MSNAVVADVFVYLGLACCFVGAWHTIFRIYQMKLCDVACMLFAKIITRKNIGYLKGGRKEALPIRHISCDSVGRHGDDRVGQSAYKCVAVIGVWYGTV